MLSLLVLVFVVVPLVEILVIIQVSGVIGAWWTVGILVADSVLGAWLLRREGARAWRELRDALEAGRWPGDAVAHGAMVLVGGTLLVTPGFVTDAVGFAMLLRGVRSLVIALVRARTGTGPRQRRARGTPRTDSRRRTGAVLDVEVVDVRREPDQEPDHEPDTIRELGEIDRDASDDAAGGTNTT